MKIDEFEFRPLLLLLTFLDKTVDPRYATNNRIETLL